MKTDNNVQLIAAGIMALLLAGFVGCTSDLTSTTYSRGEARQVQTVQSGTVTGIENVRIEGTTGIGALAGGAAGGIGASGIGGGKGSAIASIGGALLGGYLGGKAEDELTGSTGVNLTIRLANGDYIAVVQQVDPAMIFRTGDKVIIYGQGDTARVVKDTSQYQ